MLGFNGLRDSLVSFRRTFRICLTIIRLENVVPGSGKFTMIMDALPDSFVSTTCTHSVYLHFLCYNYSLDPGKA